MECTPSDEAEGQAIVRVLAAVLERLVSANSHISTPAQEQTRFHAQRAPAIGILQYLERIHKYACCSKECFILALIYIDRLIQRTNFLLTELNIHRVVITAILLAAKFFDDAYYNNAYYAKVGGVLVEEMNNLEAQFLFKIDFSLRVLPEVFEKYNAELLLHSNVMRLEGIACSTDEELLSVPHQAQDSLNIVSHHISAVEAAPPAPLQTYSQSEFEYPIVYPTPTYDMPQDELVTSHDLLLQQQGLALDSVCPCQALASQVNAHQQALIPSEQNLSELEILYKYVMPADAINHDVALSQYTPPPIQAIYNGLTQSQGSDLDQVYSSPAVPTDGLYSYYYPIQVTASGAPSYSQHTNYICSNGTAVQATTREMAQNHHHHHPEITPSPPPHRPMSIHGAPTSHHTGQVGCSINHLYSLPYLKQSSSSSAASASLKHGHYYATPADAAIAMHHQQQLTPSRPIAIGNHHVVTHENHWACRLSVERSASASGST